MRASTPKSALLLALLLALSGCGGEDKPQPPGDRADAGTVAAPSAPLCPFAGDGVCDEPASCALGTDSADCDAACAAPDPPARLYGACTFRARGLPDHEAVDPDLAKRGSHGSGGLYGWSWGSILARNPGGSSLPPVRRYYMAYVPDTYDPARPAPLMYYLAGFGVSMYGNAGWTDQNQLAERNGVIVVYVQQHYRNMGKHGWMMGWHVYLQAFRGTDPNDPAQWSDNPDLDFLVKLTERLKGLYNIDRTRVWTTGHSRGGGMSVILPFLRPDVFAGSCGQAAFSHVNKFEDFIRAYKGRRFPAVLVHGTMDDNVQPSEYHATVKAYRDAGWKTLADLQKEGRDPSEETLRDYFIPAQGHRWQPDLNQEWFDFLYARPIPLNEVAP